MAVTQNPIIGRARNKVGGVIFQTWKGKNVLRSKPLTVANPRTDLQIAQRNKMQIAVFLYREAAGAIKAGFVQQAVGQSEYNAFVSNAMRNSMTVSGTTVTLVDADLKYSKGTIAIAGGYTAVGGTLDDDIDYSWNATPLKPGQSAGDTFVAVFKNDTNFIREVVFTGISRSAAGGTVTTALGITAGDVIHTYGFFVNAAGNKTSDSQYVTFTK